MHDMLNDSQPQPDPAVVEAHKRGHEAARTEATETVTQFADRMAHKFTEMAIALPVTRAMAFRDAARLLRQEVGLEAWRP